ncbi:transcriptional regulator [Methanobrevibacter arboriphilus JCM 13429 = DSM 1125]|uniref:Transcriptional regulator n=1 Tax=Methanobrevibacter arboriphilus JCM 13429 = DSM 1125 TaxID=1300164 RepID=A0A1V6N344_METAZ|nr:LytTR family DNA-binding domain-containing protein [Methanobrevibacter arboriphilus]OQD58983.1 transcriptional regulator [Methanobrevibacter arboriphilus JCM 13429 = DSM 1125]
MKVEIKLSNEIKEPYAVIFTDKITDEIQKAIETLETQSSSLIILKNKDKIFIKSIEEIFMVQSANNQVIVYDENEKYASNKRLYELEKILGENFFRISKSTIINIKEIDNVIPLFKGVMHVKMKNGLESNISRKYLPKFKKYIGL